MCRTVQDVWDKFERWKKRYETVCHKAIDEIVSCGYSDLDGGLCFSKWYELNQDLILDLGISESELSNRITEKIQFLRGYLVDISYDGPEFMVKHSNFLTFQYPSSLSGNKHIPTFE